MATTFSGARLLDVEAAAARCSMSPRTLRYLANVRRVPSIKIGRLLRFDVAELDAWIDQHRVPVQEPAP